MREDKHPIQRVMERLDDVGATYLAVWFVLALLAFVSLALVAVSG